jgi:hypothetical protein
VYSVVVFHQIQLFHTDVVVSNPFHYVTQLFHILRRYERGMQHLAIFPIDPSHFIATINEHLCG